MASRALKPSCATGAGRGTTGKSLHDAGDQVVAILHQRGRSKASGMLLEMSLAQVFTMRDGLQTRMEMYSDVTEAMRAAGLPEESSGLA
jgi:ketosteroid isomerase-like protein